MRYYIIAGEASGDLHGSNLIRGLKTEDPNAEFRLWGGSQMLTAATFDGGPAPITSPGSLTAADLRGSEILVKDYKEGAVMGFTEVLAKAGKLLANIKFCKEDILEWKPDVVILIDYPGFNMKIAKFCHSHGIRVFYYIAPKTWASREGRNRKLKRWVDKLFIVFPFEVPYFEKHGIPFEYAGNPLLDAVDNHKFVRPSEGSYLALLAGSRISEIKRMMPVCMEVADRLGVKVVIAGAPARSIEDYAPFIGDRKNVEVIFGRTYDILRYADAAIINSGTASLEAALIGTPQVVCWSTSAVTAFLARRIFHILDNIKYISLGNLCIDKCAFRELIQEEFTADNVLNEVKRLVGDNDYREQMLDDYADIRQSLGGRGASRAVAKAIIKELNNQ